MKSGKRFIKKNNNRMLLFINITIVVILVLAISLFGKVIIDKLGQINFKEINKSELAMNNELYNSVSSELSTNEFNNVKNILLFGIDSKDSDRKSNKKN